MLFHPEDLLAPRRPTFYQLVSSCISRNHDDKLRSRGIYHKLNSTRMQEAPGFSQ